jgi:DNA-binding response OmpR family regulator
MEATTPSIKVLIIDDDTKLLRLLSDYLPRFQIEVATAASAQEGLRRLEAMGIDLVILDVLMPGMDGFETCREIRRRGKTPVIMLSARGDAMDKIVGLELGADDYMSKPFEPRELVTRIRAILRRTAVPDSAADLRIGELEIRMAERAASLKGASMELTSMEFELLKLLAGRAGQPLARDDISRYLQGSQNAGSGRSVDILVSRLRAKLGEDARNAKYIKSVHGFGYVFLGKPE